MKKKLFIAGCARSGTSALAHLIGVNKDVVMGMERYGEFYKKDDFRIANNLFTKERFLDVRNGDTFYDDFAKFHRWDSNIENKLINGSYRYIGDKRPEIYEVYDEIYSVFPDAKCIFIYRDLFEVAASWNKRAEAKENWPATKDFKKAVFAWNNSLRLTLSALERYPEKIACVNYRDVFIDNRNLGPLYNWLELEFDRETVEKYENILANSLRLQKERSEYSLSAEQRAFCESNADFRFESMLDEKNILL
ncbi:sulfotransferase [Aliikangiella sp. G2MR2-5]|uniref:sulfotransferase family protein n=1 Tax=Aliikangiella sp. G2MR2-5 TaxID=2788943 RepID=UPI0018A8CC65|nr:sulfotransferase [Aliikangiella sp. G2MR2-5]